MYAIREGRRAHKPNTSLPACCRDFSPVGMHVRRFTQRGADGLPHVRQHHLHTTIRCQCSAQSRDGARSHMLVCGLQSLKRRASAAAVGADGTLRTFAHARKDAIIEVQVAATDAGRRHFDDGIPPAHSVDQVSHRQELALCHTEGCQTAGSGEERLRRRECARVIDHRLRSL